MHALVRQPAKYRRHLVAAAIVLAFVCIPLLRQAVISVPCEDATFEWSNWRSIARGRMVGQGKGSSCQTVEEEGVQTTTLPAAFAKYTPAIEMQNATNATSSPQDTRKALEQTAAAAEDSRIRFESITRLEEEQPTPPPTSTRESEGAIFESITRLEEEPTATDLTTISESSTQIAEPTATEEGQLGDPTTNPQNGEQGAEPTASAEGDGQSTESSSDNQQPLEGPSTTEEQANQEQANQEEANQQPVETPEPCSPSTAWGARPLSAVNNTFYLSSSITYSPSGPRPDQVVFLTATDGKGNSGNDAIHNVVDMAIENRDQYCDYHGYHHLFINISKYDLGDCAHAVWKKVPAIIEAFDTYPEAQWVFWVDVDAIVMSPQRDVHSSMLSHEGMRKSLELGGEFISWPAVTRLGMFVPEEPDFAEIDLLMAQDENGLNAGVFFIRRSRYTQWLLDVWADPFFMRMDWPQREQEVLVSIDRFSNSRIYADVVATATLHQASSQLPLASRTDQAASHQCVRARVSG